MSDAQIFDLIDDALYTGEPTEQRSRYEPFDFLAGTGEQFYDFKTFIVCRPDGRVCILYQLCDDTLGFALCSIESFCNVAKSFIHWFDEQVMNTSPPFFPINPFNLDEIIIEDHSD